MVHQPYHIFYTEIYSTTLAMTAFQHAQTRTKKAKTTALQQFLEEFSLYM